MPIIIPTKAFLTKGRGVHKDKITSFEYALRDAGIEAYNFVPVSSIFPPNAKLISRREGIKKLAKYKGGILYCIMSRIETNEPRLITAALGCAVPENNKIHGYIYEHQCYDQAEKEAEDHVKHLVSGMFETLEGGVDKSTLESTAISAKGETGLWTTVIAVCVFCDYS